MYWIKSKKFFKQLVARSSVQVIDNIIFKSISFEVFYHVLHTTTMLEAELLAKRQELASTQLQPGSHGLYSHLWSQKPSNIQKLHEFSHSVFKLQFSRPSNNQQAVSFFVHNKIKLSADILIRCGTVVRDFESEAKTWQNF